MIITYDLFFLSGMFCCVILFFYLIWTSGKSIVFRILCTVFPILLAFFLFLPEPVSSSSFMERNDRMLFSSLRSLLEAEKSPVPVSAIADALKEQSLLRIALELERLNRPPPKSLIIRRNDFIQRPPEERRPDPPIFRQFPIGEGKAEFTPALAARIEQLEREISSDYWQGKGVIVTGQLRVEGSESMEGVASCTRYYPNGVFAHALYPNAERELQFFKSGYEPLGIWLDPQKKHPKQLDLGVLHLKKSTRTFPLTFTLYLPKKEAKAVFRLQTAFPAPTWHDWGYECAAPVQTTVIQKTITNGESISVDGLSAIPYQLDLEAPECIGRTFYFTGDHPVNLGDIALQTARRQTFRLRSFSGGDWKRVTLVLNGKTSLVIGPKDSLGNLVDLRLTPDPNSKNILAFFPWHPVYFDDYGEISPEAVPLPEPSHWEGSLFLQPGHLYRIKSAQKKIDKLIYLEPAAKDL